MSDGDADAKTSAGAPDTIWVARAPDDPKLNVTVVPGCSRWNPVASWVKVPVRDEAADTVIDPESDAPVVVVVPSEDELEQAAATNARTPVATIAHRRATGRRVTG
jgi:hypothetical protein